jgi:hypothetical protein
VSIDIKKEMNGLEGAIEIHESGDELKLTCESVKENVMEILRFAYPQGKTGEGVLDMSRNIFFKGRIYFNYHQRQYELDIVEEEGGSVRVHITFPNENRSNRRVLNRVASDIRFLYSFGHIFGRA